MAGKKARGKKAKTRHLLRRRRRATVRDFLKSFSAGERVVLNPQPSVPKGMPFRRFFGKIGEVVGKRGKAYEVKLMDGKKEKRQLVLPVHLKKLKTEKR